MPPCPAPLCAHRFQGGGSPDNFYIQKRARWKLEAYETNIFENTSSLFRFEVHFIQLVLRTQRAYGDDLFYLCNAHLKNVPGGADAFTPVGPPFQLGRSLDWNSSELWHPKKSRNSWPLAWRSLATRGFRARRPRTGPLDASFWCLVGGLSLCIVPKRMEFTKARIKRNMKITLPPPSTLWRWKSRRRWLSPWCSLQCVSWKTSSESCKWSTPREPQPRAINQWTSIIFSQQPTKAWNHGAFLHLSFYCTILYIH